jgi:hypothetical protein
LEDDKHGSANRRPYLLSPIRRIIREKRKVISIKRKEEQDKVDDAEECKLVQKYNSTRMYRIINKRANNER